MIRGLIIFIVLTSSQSILAKKYPVMRALQNDLPNNTALAFVSLEFPILLFGDVGE